MTPHVSHPVVFFINESRPGELSEVPNAEIFDKMVYYTPVWQRTLNLAYDVGGSAKQLEPREDLRLVQDGDVLVYTGKSGKAIAQYFEGHCPNAQTLKARELFDPEKMEDVKSKAIIN